MNNLNLDKSEQIHEALYAYDDDGKPAILAERSNLDNIYYCRLCIHSDIDAKTMTTHLQKHLKY